MQFAQVIGQHFLKQQLLNSVKSDQVAHAQLFFGKAGYGPLPIALAFAQYLFCESKSESDSCGTCTNCKRVNSLQHPDLHFSFPITTDDKNKSKHSSFYYKEWRELVQNDPYFDLFDWVRVIDEKKTRNPLIAAEECLEIERLLSLKSFEGGYKIAIIWMPETMNDSGSNRLLKLIEEPPSNTFIFFVAESIDRLLPTIISRTRIYPVPRIDMDTLSDTLKRQFSIDDEQATSLAARVDGDYVEARSSNESIVEQQENRELFIKLMRVCYRKNVNEMLEWSAGISQIGRFRQKVFLEYALHMIRQSLLKNYTGDQLIRVSEEERSFLDNFARYITGNNIFGFIKEFDQAHYHIERNANPKMLFTNLCFQVMRFIHAA